MATNVHLLRFSFISRKFVNIMLFEGIRAVLVRENTLICIKGNSNTSNFFTCFIDDRYVGIHLPYGQKETESS
jgi:hypothetical protein